MDHVTDIEIIELVAGNLPAGRQSAVERHLQVCPDCRSRRDELARTWHVLGQWRVEASGRDLRPRIERALGRRAAGVPAKTWGSRVLAGLRAAAAVLLAVGIGHLAGRWTRPSGSGPGEAGPPAVARVTESAVAESLHFGVIQQVSPAGLAESVLAQPVPGSQGR